jgi:FHS family glucose/mannose:H+ symporter-like MFS transporter
LTALATASFLAFGALLVLFGSNATEIMASQNLDYADFGLLGSMLSMGLGIGICIAGPVSDRLPNRPLYIISCLVVIVATTTLGRDTTYTHLLISTVAIGFGAGFYETILNSMIYRKFADGAGRRLLFVHSGASFAACVVPLLIGFSRSNSDLAWYTSFQIAGLLHIPLIVASFGVDLTKQSPIRRTQATDVEVPPRARPTDKSTLVAICVAIFAYVGVESALTIFVADHAARDLGLDAVRAARSISAFWGGLLVGRLLAGASPRAPGPGFIAVAASLTVFVVLGFGRGLFDAPEIPMLAIGLALGAVFPVMVSLAGRTLPESPATAVGLAAGMGSFGGFVVPWVTGILASEAGLPFAIAALSVWLGLLAIAAAATRLRQAS